MIKLTKDMRKRNCHISPIFSSRTHDYFWEKGLKLRATVTEFGPVLLSKILGLNETQSSIMSIVFKYADDKALPLIDLDDLKKVLQYVTDNAEGKKN